jgi:hypothetical protein
VHADELLTAFLELERAICVGLLTEQTLKVTGAVAEWGEAAALPYISPCMG